MQPQKSVKYGLSLNQATEMRDQGTITSVAFETESLGVVGALMCFIGFLLILADSGKR